MNILTPNQILSRIEYFLTKKKWSRYRLAKESNIPYSSLDNLYKRNSYPSIPMLYKICQSFNISLHEFFYEEPSQNIFTCRIIKLIETFDEEQLRQIYNYAEYLYHEHSNFLP